MPYYRRKITSGRLVEIETYYATRDGTPITRGRNLRQEDETQRAQNERRSWQRLNRLMHANFDGRRGDLFATFTHAGELTEAEAAKEGRNLIDRLGRAWRRKGLEGSQLKYILITERQGRWHHHLIVTGGLELDELEAVWNGRRRRGRWQVSRLDEQGGYEALARYLIKQRKPPKGQPDAESVKEPRAKYARRWSASRNLEEPIVERERLPGAPRGTEPRAPKGATLLPDWVTGTDRDGRRYQYYAYLMDKPKKRKRQRRPRHDTAGAKRGRGADAAV